MGIPRRAAARLRANAVAYLALFIALGGTAFAAAKVGPNGIRADAVRSKHIKDAQVRPADLAPALRTRAFEFAGGTAAGQSQLLTIAGVTLTARCDFHAAQGFRTIVGIRSQAEDWDFVADDGESSLSEIGLGSGDGADALALQNESGTLTYRSTGGSLVIASFASLNPDPTCELFGNAASS